MIRTGIRRTVGLSENEVLAKVPLFAGLPDEERERLGSLLRPRRYARGEIDRAEFEEKRKDLS